MKTYFFAKTLPRDDAIAALIRDLHKLDPNKAYRLELSEQRNTRTLQQNAYLWGVCYSTILSEAGEALAGWEAQDLHEYFLGEHFGWETVEGFGRKRMRPIRRSSKLSVMEFASYVDFVHRKAAEYGIYIPSPDEMAA